MQEFHAVLELLAMLVMDPRMVVLFVLLVIAAVSDYRSYKIPNWLTFGGTAFALIYTVVATAHLLPAALLQAGGGLLMGFLITLPFYALGIMGAGDVKLMAMVGAFLGIHETLQAVLFTFIVGGMAALGFSVFKRQFVRLLSNVKTAALGIAVSGMAGIRPDVRVAAGQSVGKLPYGVCICIGTLAYVIGHQLGLA